MQSITQRHKINQGTFTTLISSVTKEMLGMEVNQSLILLIIARVIGIQKDNCGQKRICQR